MVKIVKKPDDPLCLRASLGGTSMEGFYVVYRGPLQEIRHLVRSGLKGLLELVSEPAVEPDAVPSEDAGASFEVWMEWFLRETLKSGNLHDVEQFPEQYQILKLAMKAAYLHGLKEKAA